MDSKCKNCEHWKMYNANDGTDGKKLFKGCIIWNNWKHFDKTPYGVSLSFEECFNENGPKISYTGWAGKGHLYNDSILTDGEQSCKFLSLYKNLPVKLPPKNLSIASSFKVFFADFKARLSL